MCPLDRRGRGTVWCLCELGQMHNRIIAALLAEIADWYEVGLPWVCALLWATRYVFEFELVIQFWLAARSSAFWFVKVWWSLNE